jgi:hypothetical protein
VLRRSPCADRATIVNVPTWATLRLWPGWERDAFLAWCADGGYVGGREPYVESADPWALFAEWWRVDGSWR